MRCYSILSLLLLLGLLGLAQALSATGNRLLVVLDDDADKDKYTKFWSDLSGKARARRTSMSCEARLIHPL